MFLTPESNVFIYFCHKFLEYLKEFYSRMRSLIQNSFVMYFFNKHRKFTTTRACVRLEQINQSEIRYSNCFFDSNNVRSLIPRIELKFFIKKQNGGYCVKIELC